MYDSSSFLGVSKSFVSSFHEQSSKDFAQIQNKLIQHRLKKTQLRHTKFSSSIMKE